MVIYRYHQLEPLHCPSVSLCPGVGAGRQVRVWARAGATFLSVCVVSVKKSGRVDGPGKEQQMASKEQVAQQIEIIKTRMPYTWALIEDRAKHIGNDAYAYVRRGLRGERGCFYAIEAGHVVGTPAGLPQDTLQELADYIVIMGCAHVCIWPASAWRARDAAQPPAVGGEHGAD